MLKDLTMKLSKSLCENQFCINQIDPVICDFVGEKSKPLFQRHSCVNFITNIIYMHAQI